MKYLALILITTTLFSCKEDLRELEACFIADKDSLSRGDSVLFTNCSVADTTMIVIHDLSDLQTYNGPAYNFSNDSVYVVFADSGEYRATLRAWNFQHNTELKEDYETIRVY